MAQTRPPSGLCKLGCYGWVFFLLFFFFHIHVLFSETLSFDSDVSVSVVVSVWLWRETFSTETHEKSLLRNTCRCRWGLQRGQPCSRAAVQPCNREGCAAGEALPSSHVCFLLLRRRSVGQQQAHASMLACVHQTCDQIIAIICYG